MVTEGTVEDRSRSAAAPAAPPAARPMPAGVAPAAGGACPADPSRITLRELKAVARKGGAGSGDDPFWLSRYFYRGFTIYVTWVCVKLRVSSNAATLLSALAIFAGAACYALPQPLAWLWGAVLVQVYFILDHVDGELARYERICLGRESGVAGLFYDTCCHAGELALLAGIGMRLFHDLGAPWWVAVVVMLAFFPGYIMPWQRYCEALVTYAGRHIEGEHATLEAELVRTSSFAIAPAADQITSGKVISVITQFIGFPGYFVTLLILTLLDVLGAPQLHVGGRRIPYLLIWMAIRAAHGSAAALKSTAVYGRRLTSLK